MVKGNLRQLTLADLQKAQRQYVTQQALGQWLKHPQAFRVEEQYWPDLLTKLSVSDGTSILELGAGKTSLITALGGGVYYEYIDEDSRLTKLQADVFPEGRFCAIRTEDLVKGEPSQTVTLAVVYLDNEGRMLPKNPCFEATQEAPTSGWIRLQTAYKALMENGYLLVIGKLTDAQMDWLKERMQMHWSGRLGPERVLIAQRTLRFIPGDPPTAMPEVLPPVPTVSTDPRPLQIKPWDITIVQAKPNKRAQTEVVRKGTRMALDFADDTAALTWAGYVLQNQTDASWKTAVEKATEKLETKNYLRLRAEGRTIQDLVGMPDGWPVQESIPTERYLRRLDRRLKRSALSYPEVTDPVRQYYALGVGSKVRADTGEELIVTLVECSLTEPPKLTLEPAP